MLDIAIAGSFVGGVDLSPMQASDTIELRIYKIFKAGGTRRETYYFTTSDAQTEGDIGVVFVPISNALTDSGSIRYTLKQTAGTNRTYDWEVLKLG